MGNGYRSRMLLLTRIRGALAAIFLFGALGTGTELLLLDHTESASQWFPLILLAAGALGITTLWARPSRTAVHLVRILMAALIFSGFLGIWFHYRGSAEFQAELKPSLTGFDLFWKALRSKAPPALAPGVMMQLGLIGILMTVRHPELSRRTDGDSNREIS